MNRSLSVVAIVLDGAYANLRETSQRMAVWAVDTPANRATMTQLWSENKDKAPSNDRTLFKVAEGTSKESQLLSKVPTIEMHHPEGTSLLIIGLSETPTLSDGLLELGYSLERRGAALLAIKQEQ